MLERKSSLHPLWHSYLLFAVLGSFAAIQPLPALVGMAFLIILDHRLFNLPRLSFSILCACIGCAYVYIHFRQANYAVSNPPDWIRLEKKGSRFCGRVVHAQGLPENRMRVLLADLHPADQTDSQGISGYAQLTWASPAFSLLPGQTLCLSRPIRPVRQAAFAANSAFELSLLSHDVLWQIWMEGEKGDPVASGKPFWLAKIRLQAQQAFLRALACPDQSTTSLSQGAAILPAILFGDRSFLSQESINNFSISTLAHSLALSGQHLTVAGLFGYALTLLIAHYYPQLYLRKPKIVWITISSLPFACLYLWIGNAPPSLTRAFAMLSIFAFFLWRRSVFSAIDILAAALLIILFFQPLLVFDLGLQLSALCVGAILLTWPIIARIAPKTDKNASFLHNAAARIAQIFLVSLLLQIVLLPLTLTRFQTVGFLFPLNILWLPVLGFFVLPVSAAGLLISCIPGESAEICAHYILKAANLPCQWLIDLMEGLKSIGIMKDLAWLMPHWTLFIAYALLAFAGIKLFFSRGKWGQTLKDRILLAAILIMLGIAPIQRLLGVMKQNVSLELLDVGQGQAVLIKYPGGKALIDAGGSFSKYFAPGKSLTAPALLDNSAPVIDVAINSHPDIDHLGGLFYIFDAFKVRNAFHNGNETTITVKTKWMHYQQEFKAKILRAGDEIILGQPEDELKLQVLHPPDPAGLQDLFEKEWKGNNASIVLLLSHKGRNLALIPGDAELPALNRLLETAVDLDAKLLIAPHHGSDNSFMEEFYGEVNPQLVLVSCGSQNRAKFPGPKLRAYLEEEGIELLDTANMGKIIITFDDKGDWTKTVERKTLF